MVPRDISRADDSRLASYRDAIESLPRGLRQKYVLDLIRCEQKRREKLLTKGEEK